MRQIITYTSSILLVAALSACGGGGSDDGGSSSGGSAAGAGGASVDASELGVAAASLSAQLIAQDGNTSNLAPTFGKPNNGQRSLQSTFSDIASLTLSETLVETGDCGGTITSDYTLNADDTNIYPFDVESESVFSNYCEEIDANGNIVFNGSIYVEMDFPSATQGTSFWRFDLSYTSNHPLAIPASGSWYEEISCTYTNGISYGFDDESCTGSFIFENDDAEYRTENVTVNGDNSNGYDVSFEFSDEANNEYSATFSDVTVCTNGNIGSGSGEITINEESVVIDFVSCDEFNVTYNGQVTTVQQ